MKKNYFLVAAGLGFVQLLLFNVTAHAQDTTKVLNDVVVTATRSPQKQSEIGRVVTVITADDIKHAQGKTLPELLNTVPGIVFSGANNAPGISSDVYLRGATTGNTLILIDGFPVNNASTTDGSYDLNAFPLDQIDHIEILKGSGSTLYGSDAVAGVINIITKHAKGQGLKSNIQLSGGTYDTFKESAGVNGNIKNTGVAINLSNTDSHGFPAVTDTTGKGGFRNDDFHQRSASVNLNQKVSDNLVINGNFQGSYNTGHLPQEAFTDDQNFTYANTFLFAGLGADLKIHKGDLKFNVSENDVKNNYNDLAGASNSDFGSYQKNTGNITDAEALFNYELNKYLSITSGADFKHRSTNQLSTFDTIPKAKANDNIANVYTSLFFKMGIFHMELGGGYDHDSRYGNKFNYTVSPSLLLFDQLKIFATAASAFKAPSLYQLFSQYGSPFLKPETTTSYEAGFNWELINNRLSFNTVFYQYQTKDVIYFLEESGPPYGKYENGSFQKDKGFESELKYHDNDFTASASYAYVTGALTDENGVVTNYLIRRPKNIYGANIYYQFISNFSAGVNYRYTGDRSDENFSTGSIVTLKHYNLVDLHLQYEANKRISLFAELKNLLDEKYTDWLGYNTARFNFMAGIKYQIN